jgi:Nif-specific regulatory protein
MAIARLVVIEGPDVGCEFSIPMRGGGIGRGEENVVQLSDLAVSRSHCRLEFKSGQLTLIDGGSRNRTRVNGKPIDTHILVEGDEIAIGTTRLSFLPVPVAATRSRQHSRVTMEVGSRQLLALTGDRLASGDGRAQRYLTALSQLGETLGALDDRSHLAAAATETSLSALAADRVLVLLRHPDGKLPVEACAIAPGEPRSSEFDPPEDLVAKVLGEGKCIASDDGDGDDDGASSGDERRAIAAPLVVRGRALGLLYAERRGEPPWDQIDLTAIACLANLIAGGFEGVDSHRSLEAENRDLRDRLGGRDFVGRSPAATQLLRFVAKVGPTDATVLLTGESGSGKEMVAQSIHASSRRTRARFVAVNCAALTETLIESELFGHEKGAFTGASERKVGRFEAADGGSLFLDEVGELPLDCQTKFLRVLEEQCFERVGGTRPLRVDVRVIAATNRDLAAMVGAGQFREDLYYRLSVIHTQVPTLRERPEDIALLAEHFLEKLKRQVPRRIRGFEPAALEAMQRHVWPGNVRELRNAVERAIVMGEGERIGVADLPPHVLAGRPATRSIEPRMPTPVPMAPAAPPVVGELLSAPLPLRDLERAGIIAALRATGGNKAQAANLLQIDRSTLYKKIKDYEIDPG